MAPRLVANTTLAAAAMLAAVNLAAAAVIAAETVAAEVEMAAAAVVMASAAAAPVAAAVVVVAALLLVAFMRPVMPPVLCTISVVFPSQTGDDDPRRVIIARWTLSSLCLSSARAFLFPRLSRMVNTRAENVTRRETPEIIWEAMFH